LADISSNPHWSAKDTLQSAVQDSYWKYYGPDDAPCHERQTGNNSKGCYWDGSTKGFIANYQAGLRVPNVGANDTQANAIVHMVPVVAALAGNVDESHMLTAVESLIRVTQNTDQAVAFGLATARILSRVIQGQTPLDAVTAVVEDLQDTKRVCPQAEDQFLAQGLKKVLAEVGLPNFDVVKTVGQACDYPYNLWGGSHLAAQLSPLSSAAPTQSFMLAIRQTIEAGGDSASRGNFVGALFGAAAGEAALPAEWKAKYLHYNTVLADAKKLLVKTSTERILM
jgi:ADP-ribosylglycohydrolase